MWCSVRAIGRLENGFGERAVSRGLLDAPAPAAWGKKKPEAPASEAEPSKLSEKHEKLLAGYLLVNLDFSRF